MLDKEKSKFIKVCHVTSMHPRYDVRIFHKQCKSLQNNGYDVTLLVNDINSDEKIDGVRIVSTNIDPKNRYNRFIKSKKRLKKKMLEIDADIYQFHDPDLLSEAAWMKKKGKKVIFDFHEDVSQQILYKSWIPKKLRPLVSKAYQRFEKIKVSKFDALITVTPKFVERLKQFNKNTVMVTNYPIIKANTYNENSIKNRVICFAGGISSQWNHHNIIKAIESIDDIEYILAGSGSKDYIESLQQKQGWNKVKYLGKVPHEEVNDIYSKAMIGMTLLSNNTQVGDEGTLGNTKIFEFMAAGLPIICSDNNLWRDIVSKYQCGIAINPNNIKDISDTIELILKNENNESTLMGMNGKRAVETEYNWETQELELLKLYKSI